MKLNNFPKKMLKLNDKKLNFQNLFFFRNLADHQANCNASPSPNINNLSPEAQSAAAHKFVQRTIEEEGSKTVKVKAATGGNHAIYHISKEEPKQVEFSHNWMTTTSTDLNLTTRQTQGLARSMREGAGFRVVEKSFEAKYKEQNVMFEDIFGKGKIDDLPVGYCTNVPECFKRLGFQGTIKVGGDSGKGKFVVSASEFDEDDEDFDGPAPAKKARYSKQSKRCTAVLLVGSEVKDLK